MSLTPVPQRILCLGNDIIGDDGVGLVIGKELLSRGLPDGVSVELAVHLDLDLLSTLNQRQELLLVDAVQGQDPGRCELGELDLSGAPPPPALHALDLAGLFTLAQRLVPERLPTKLHLLSVQVGPLDRFAECLSAPVAAAVPRAVALAMHWILPVPGADLTLGS